MKILWSVHCSKQLLFCILLRALGSSDTSRSVSVHSSLSWSNKQPLYPPVEMQGYSQLSNSNNPLQTESLASSKKTCQTPLVLADNGHWELAAGAETERCLCIWTFNKPSIITNISPHPMTFSKKSSLIPNAPVFFSTTFYIPAFKSWKLLSSIKFYLLFYNHIYKKIYSLNTVY